MSARSDGNLEIRAAADRLLLKMTGRDARPTVYDRLGLCSS
ncbi:MAG: hypothetical protein V1792_27485 [Pseudomonadota bacterium]